MTTRISYLSCVCGKFIFLRKGTEGGTARIDAHGATLLGFHMAEGMGLGDVVGSAGECMAVQG